MGYPVQSVQGKVNTVDHTDYASLENYRHTNVYMLFNMFKATPSGNPVSHPPPASIIENCRVSETASLRMRNEFN